MEQEIINHDWMSIWVHLRTQCIFYLLWNRNSTRIYCFFIFKEHLEYWECVLEHNLQFLIDGLCIWKVRFQVDVTHLFSLSPLILLDWKSLQCDLQTPLSEFTLPIHLLNELIILHLYVSWFLFCIPLPPIPFFPFLSPPEWIAD